jgi:molecular chaperone GrpE
MTEEMKKEEEKKQEPAAKAEKNGEKAAQEQPKTVEKTAEDIIKEKDAKINELTDKYLRSLAELDNYRKRVQKDKEDFAKFAKGDAISLFLPVMDNFQRALSSTEKIKDFEQLKKGIEMVIKQFEGALKELGAKEIKTEGIFDPLYHHVMHKEIVADKKDGEILEVYQKGYMMDDKIIRPAMVKIAHNDVHKNNEHKDDEHKDDRK